MVRKCVSIVAVVGRVPYKFLAVELRSSVTLLICSRSVVTSLHSLAHSACDVVNLQKVDVAEQENSRSCAHDPTPPLDLNSL